MMEKLTIERISMVGGGRHMRLKLRSGNYSLPAICFSATPESFSIEPGDVVDVAFSPQINEYRGERSVQMHILDIRPHCSADCCPEACGYWNLHKGTVDTLSAGKLLPDRNTLARVWRYLAASNSPLREDPLCLCRKIVRWSNLPLSLGQMLTCLDIFQDVELLRLEHQHRHISIEIIPNAPKADLNDSKTMRLLVQAKES